MLLYIPDSLLYKGDVVSIWIYPFYADNSVIFALINTKLAWVNNLCPLASAGLFLKVSLWTIVFQQESTKDTAVDHNGH